MDLSPEVHAFIAESISSVEMLEVLLLLHRAPDTYWGVPAISHQLGLKKELVRTATQRLAEHHLVATSHTTDAYRFEADEGRTATTDALADAYRDQRIQVINTIYSENLRRLRAFSDAFRIRGE